MTTNEKWGGVALVATKHHTTTTTTSRSASHGMAVNWLLVDSTRHIKRHSSASIIHFVSGMWAATPEIKFGDVIKWRWRHSINFICAIHVVHNILCRAGAGGLKHAGIFAIPDDATGGGNATINDVCGFHSSAVITIISSTGDDPLWYICYLHFIFLMPLWRCLLKQSETIGAVVCAVLIAY